jgi:hypothetical protein
MAIDKEKIAKLLTARGAVHPCHRCGSTEFVVLDSYGNFHLQDDFSAGLVIGGQSVPVALVACVICGAITPHAIGVLGLLGGEKK